MGWEETFNKTFDRFKNEVQIPQCSEALFFPVKWQLAMKTHYGFQVKTHPDFICHGYPLRGARGFPSSPSWLPRSDKTKLAGIIHPVTEIKHREGILIIMTHVENHSTN